MKYYIDLPEYFNKFVKSIDISSIENFYGHTWKRFSPNDVLTQDGLNWFNERNLQIHHCNLFNLHEQTVGDIHVDVIGNNFAGFALNFILHGEGEMQWTEIDGELSLQKKHNSYFYGYENIKNITILERWSGNMAIVKVNIPHRVISYDTRRVVLSLRFMQPYTFENFEKILSS